MKKSYIKMILFILFFSFLFLLDSFVFKIINQTVLDVVILFMLLLTFIFFGFEKDKHRYTKDIILEIIIFLVGFFLLYYLSGILIGFAKVNNYYTIKSFVNIIIPLIIFITLKEFLRYQLITKSSESKILIVFVCVLFVIIDNVTSFGAHTIKFDKETFLLVAITFLPSISENILCSFLSLKFGYKPNIIYLLIVKLYSYLLPLVPNPNEYLYSLIFLIFPLLVFLKIKNWISKDRTNAIDIQDYNCNKQTIFYFLPLILFTALLVYVVSGYFRYYAIAVASGSMEPQISKGDVVIVDTNVKDYTKSDIIAYRYEGKIIVHRIFKIVNTDKDFFIYTKGDANNDYDKYKITKDMIIGVVKFKIPVIGYPTVLLNERW